MEKADSSFRVRVAGRNDWEEAMGLAWKTFLRFEAPDYTPDGVRSFQDFITDSTLHKMFIIGNYQMFAAFEEDRMVGMITLRNENHISLLFVDEQYHRRGIGRALVQTLGDYLTNEMGVHLMSVNASPFGLGFYHRLGFRDMGP